MILNFGSLNIDKVYELAHFVQAGETISSDKLSTFCGGKGLNQSIALARAGAEVCHAGKVGADGEILIEKLKDAGVDTRYISFSSGESGHAIIQVDSHGQNCIILFGGANKEITTADVDAVLKFFGKGDTMLIQNEISNIAYLIKAAHEKGLYIVCNPSPMNEELLAAPLELIDLFILNEIEGKYITKKDDPRAICYELKARYPRCRMVLTLGSDGAVYFDGTNAFTHGVYEVDIVDTTAAGDTFTGYFLASLNEGHTVEKALEWASKAASLTISRMGAADSIPVRLEVETTTVIARDHLGV